jgi:hypothetical protein
MSSVSKKKEPRYAFSFSLSSVSVNEPSPGFPIGPLWRKPPVYKAFLQVSQIPHKNYPE